jgi:hypothetical protein
VGSHIHEETFVPLLEKMLYEKVFPELGVRFVVERFVQQGVFEENQPVVKAGES